MKIWTNPEQYDFNQNKILIQILAKQWERIMLLLQHDFVVITIYTVSHEKKPPKSYP